MVRVEYCRYSDVALVQFGPVELDAVEKREFNLALDKRSVFNVAAVKASAVNFAVPETCIPEFAIPERAKQHL